MLTFISPWSNSYMQSMPWAAGGSDAAGHNPLDPNDARFYEDGEWLDDDGLGAVRRGGDNGNGNVAPYVGGTNEPVWPSYQIFAERGRTDQPVISGSRDPATGAQRSGKVAIVRIHDYEAVTDMVGPLGGLAAGDQLTVQDIQIGGAGPFRRALAERVAAIGTVFAQAYVVSVDAGNATVRYLVR